MKTDEEKLILDVKANSKILKKIREDLGLFINTSVIQFAEKKSIKIFKENPTDYQEKYENTWSYHLKPLVTITNTGIIENFKTHKRIFTDPLKTEADWEKALTKTYNYLMQKETNKWKKRIEKDQLKISIVPSVILKRIKPKLVAARDMGIFD